MYLLDTNICIYAMKGTYPKLNNMLLTIKPEDILVSTITLGELEYGASKSKWGTRTRNTLYMFLSSFTFLPFSADDAAAFGIIRASLEAAGTPIGPFDTMIAAQGVARNLTVVTHNTKEFSRVPRLKLVDWTI